MIPDADNGNSTADQESLPTTTSVLDKSRSLFGNPSAVKSETTRAPTPEIKEAESKAVADSPVTMETKEKEVPADETLAGESGEKGTQDVSPTKVVDTAQSPTDSKSDSPEPVEETFEKKVVSMDTSAVEDSQDEPGTAAHNDSNDGNNEKIEDVGSKSSNDLVIDEDEYDDDDEEEEEVPKKKAKRAALSDDDDEDKLDAESAASDVTPEQVENHESESPGPPDSSEHGSASKPQESTSVSESNGGSQGRVDDEDETGPLEKPEEKAEEDVEKEDVDVEMEDADNDDEVVNAEESAEADVKNDDIVNDVDKEDAGTAEPGNEVANHGDDGMEEVTDAVEVANVTATENVEAPGEDAEAPEEEEGAPEEDDQAPEGDVEAPTDDADAPEEEEAEAPTEDAEAIEENAEAPTEDVEAIEEDAEAPGETTPEQVPEPKSTTRSGRARKTPAVVSTPSSSTPRRGGRGRKSAVEVQEEVSTEVQAETPKRGRASRRSKNDSVQEEHDDADAVAEEGEEEAVPVKKVRSRRSAVPNKPSDDASNEASASTEPAEATPARGARSRRSAVPSNPITPAPRSARGRGRKSQINHEPSGEPDEEVQQGVEDGEDAQEEPAPKKAIRTPRARKSTAKVEPEVEDQDDASVDDAQAATSSRRSARAKAPPKASPAVANKRTPARGRKRVSVSEEAPEDPEQSSTKRGRGATKKGPSSSNKKDDYDPYDLDTEMEHHPEPLKNIHMAVHNFGDVKFGKVGQSESKYSMTEKAAESRIGDLQTSPTNKNRRSLADMTPGKEKKAKRVSVGRRSKAKKEEHHDDDIEMEDVSQADSPTTPSVHRGRKRKNEDSELAAPASKRDNPVVLKVLNDEEQLQADHPQDENEPHSVGARVYANFQKAFYPAVIIEDRDGLGRYKVQFTNDKLVKDVPNSGIIPLRDLMPGKTAFYNDKDARLDTGPDDISAEEWFKGLVSITILDDEGEPTQERKQVDWQELSFDQTEWREYIKVKEQNATSVATSNITTHGHTSRVRKPVAMPQMIRTVGRRKKGANPVNATSETIVEEDDEDKLLPMKEEAIGKNIFSGKVFMLTSANRSSNSNVASMFKKKNLMDFILQNGGIVTEQHSSFQEHHSDREPMLISDTYYRTHKYLAALARGIPCVSNMWLQECGEKGECVDYTGYILPAGASIFGEYEDMPAPENPGDLLKGKTIYIHSTHSAREVTQTGPGGTFIEIWKPILELLGATVIEGDYEKVIEDGAKFDVALVDGTFRDEVLTYADDIGASKVTSEWVIQTIILGQAPEPTAHPKFDPNRLHHRTRYD